MQVAVFEGIRGYRLPRRGTRRKGMKRGLRKRMKMCARKHRVATKGFWACVRRGHGRR